MKLSIITINRNNAAGLDKTIKSVASQTFKEFEYIVIDGASTDGSVDVIKNYELQFTHLHWISEPDTGIYNAMNKGIRMATGDYCQFLNSGDSLASADTTEKMVESLRQKEYPDILYGNMRKEMPNGKDIIDVCSASDDITLRMFYIGCLNHGPAYIRRRLFETYGFYDESLKICSDWKFYVQSIVLGTAKVRYTDILVTLFDMGGISETRKDILEEERSRLLKEMIPQGILRDYEIYSQPMTQYDRLKKHHLWGAINILERILFKLEKWRVLK